MGIPTPTALRPAQLRLGTQPATGLDRDGDGFTGVTWPAREPRAAGWNPVGIPDPPLLPLKLSRSHCSPPRDQHSGLATRLMEAHPLVRTPGPRRTTPCFRQPQFAWASEPDAGFVP